MLVRIRHDIEKQILKAYADCRLTVVGFANLNRHRKMAETFKMLLANGALHNERTADVFDLTCDVVSSRLTSAPERQNKKEALQV